MASPHNFGRYGWHFHGNSQLSQSEMSLFHLRIVGSVVLLHDIATKMCSYTVSLNGYNIMANNQHPQFIIWMGVFTSAASVFTLSWYILDTAVLRKNDT